MEINNNARNHQSKASWSPSNEQSTKAQGNVQGTREVERDSSVSYSTASPPQEQPQQEENEQVIPQS